MRRSNSYRNSYKPRSLRHQESKAKRNIVISIILGIIILYVMIVWGLPALIGGLSVFNKYKPVEKSASLGEAISPPVLNIPFESTNSAQLKINGYSTPNTTVEIYLDDQLQTTTGVGSDGTFQADDITLNLGNNSIYGKTVIEGDKKSLPSKTIKLYFDNEKPKLELSAPADNTEIKGGDKKVTVSGTTDPQNTINVNGISAIVDNQGNFSTTINLNDGDNTLTITATNPVGNSNQIQRKVTYTAS